MKIIKSAAFILAAAMALTLTACKPGRNVTTENSSDGSSSTSSNSSETFLDKASKFLEADGRGYGKEHTAEMGETLENEFFSLKVTEAYRYSSMGDYLPDDALNLRMCTMDSSHDGTEETVYTIALGDAASIPAASKSI